jgi:hypothetical protein
VSQKHLWELFGQPQWVKAKFYLIQQMQDFLIEVFRKFTTEDKPCLREAELYAFVKKHVSHLIRRNGQCYDVAVDDIDKTISGTLFGSKFFEKDLQQHTWAIDF